jgi:hypothetical protein
VAIAAASDPAATRRLPQAWQNRAPIMNSLPQSAQTSAIFLAAAESAASTAGSSTVGDRQNSCCASCATSAIPRTLVQQKQADSQNMLSANVVSTQVVATDFVS